MCVHDLILSQCVTGLFLPQLVHLGSIMFLSELSALQTRERERIYSAHS